MYTLDKIHAALESLGSAPGSWWHNDAPLNQDGVDFAREHLERCFTRPTAPVPVAKEMR
jgi:hypothetical protein